MRAPPWSPGRGLQVIMVPKSCRSLSTAFCRLSRLRHGHRFQRALGRAVAELAAVVIAPAICPAFGGQAAAVAVVAGHDLSESEAFGNPTGRLGLVIMAAAGVMQLPAIGDAFGGKT